MKYLSRHTVSDNDIDTLIELYRSNGSDKVREVSRLLRKEEIIFGLLPSDFLYYLPLNGQSKVLNVACGLGTHAFNISKFASEVHACDPSSKNISFCKERVKNEGYKNIQFFHSTIAEISFPPGTFDAIIVNDSARLLDYQRKNLHHIYKLLKQGGMLYFSTHTRFPKRLKRITRDIEFEKSDFYIAHPSHFFPRFLIPINDFAALKFVINTISADKGVVGMLLRLAIKIPFVMRGMRLFFFEYAVFIKK